MDHVTSGGISTASVALHAYDDHSSVAAAVDSCTSCENLVENVQMVVFKIVVPAIVAFGVVGNVLNIAVLTRHSMRSSTTNRYLTCQAVYDILYLVFALTLALKHYSVVGSSRPYAEYRAHVGRPLTDTWSNTGVWITVTFTVERYVCVSHPMRGIVWCTMKRANYIVAVVCSAAALLTLPEFFAYTTRVRRLPASNTTEATEEWIADDNSFGQSPSYSLGYMYVNQALFTFLPLILLVVFNGLLVRSLVKASAERKSLTSTTIPMALSKTSTMSSINDLTAGGNNGNTGNVRTATRSELPQSSAANCDYKITVMLMGVSVFFIVCQVPQAVFQMYINLTDRPLTDDLRLAATFLNLLVIINCSANFVLYSTLSTKFRRTFSIVFFRSRRTSNITTRPTSSAPNRHQINSTAAYRSNGCGYHQLLHPSSAATPRYKHGGTSPEAIRMKRVAVDL